ncbi:MAG: hypothetical protein JXC33_02945, partial [Deltaproteobacteria bacterium]|nr:hypothetical protein [Deltaproteobacteria bacterium]
RYLHAADMDVQDVPYPLRVIAGGIFLQNRIPHKTAASVLRIGQYTGLVCGFVINSGKSQTEITAIICVW